jgi:predicted transcriptional regulator
MASRHLSIRIPNDTFTRLDEESRRSGRTRSDLAKTLIEEGLRMERHPGIIFRAGPVGRRPGLAGGPDVWEVARLLQETELTGDALIARTAELIDLTSTQIRAVVSYYAAHQEEIDDWIELVDEHARLAEEAWRREEELLGR